MERLANSLQLPESMVLLYSNKRSPSFAIASSDRGVINGFDSLFFFFFFFNLFLFSLFPF